MTKLSSTDKPVTKAELAEFYQQIFPYLGGNKAVDSSPIGTVISYMGATPPAGYLACDGSKLSATAFPLLFDVLKELPSATRSTWGDADWTTEFNVPNLQGEFLRGAGTNSHTNQGNGANVGVHQDSTEVPLELLNSDTTYRIYPLHREDKTTQQNMIINSEGAIKRTIDGYNVSISRFANNIENIASTCGVRPTTTSVLYCIKYTYVFQEVNYSEDEIKVGTWIDGKDLYQRVISGSFGAITSGTVSYASLTNAIQSDVDTLTENRVICSNETQAWVADGSLRSLDGARVLLQPGYNKSNKTFYVACSDTNLSGTTLQMIVRYTKTS